MYRFSFLCSPGVMNRQSSQSIDRGRASIEAGVPADLECAW